MKFPALPRKANRVPRNGDARFDADGSSFAGQNFPRSGRMATKVEPTGPLDCKQQLALPPTVLATEQFCGRQPLQLAFTAVNAPFEAEAGYRAFGHANFTTAIADHRGS